MNKQPTQISQEFQRTVESLLSQYDGTLLGARWLEAISFGAGPEAEAYWVRDSEEVTNIVWLNSDGIRDITLLKTLMPTDDDDLDENGTANETTEESQATHSPIPLAYVEAMFNFVPLKSILTVEVREGLNVANEYGLGVTGDKLVHVVIGPRPGNLYWVSDSEEESDNLSAFLTHILQAYTHSR